jgi:DNA processing protein
MQLARRCGARFVALGEHDYPQTLARMDNPPPLLAVKGTAAAFGLPPVAIVGARNASLAGIKMARMLASELGRNGYCVISGLARGIDTAAHQGSLDTGTVGVLAGGIDRPYPPENTRLCDEIAERGAIVSEMPFGWEPRAQDFPRRNRIVAGLALGLVVVEAAQRSGSLISARLAGELGRLVFAVPGSPLDPRAAGTNGLLKDGATLVTEAADVLEALAPLVTGQPFVPTRLEEPPDFTATPPPVDGDRARVVEALGPVPVEIDELIRHTKLHPAQIFMILLELDLAGRLERHSGGRVSLVAPDM